MVRSTLVVVLLLPLIGCNLLPGRDDFEDRAIFTNETDEAVVIYWVGENGQEELMIEIQPGPPGGAVEIPKCDPRGLVARTASGEEVARRDGPTCGGWVVTDEG